MLEAAVSAVYTALDMQRQRVREASNKADR